MSPDDTEPGRVPAPDPGATQSQEGSRVMRELDEDQHAAEPRDVPQPEDDDGP